MKMLAFRECKKKLVILWLGWSAFIFLLLLVRSHSGLDGTESVWAWCVPLLAPNALLMVGVMVADAQGGQTPDRKVDAFTYHLTFMLSLFYLVLVLVSIVYDVVVTGFAVDDSKLWLSSVQGLANLALGVFFVKTVEKKS